MITTKQKKSFICSKCNMSFPNWRGKCNCGEWNTLNETAIEPKKYVIPKQSEKRKLDMKNTEGVKSDLDLWFDFQIKYELENGKCKCMNCDAPIRHQLLSKDTWVRRGSIAHIIPKRPVGGFPSVATHLHNFIILCLQCHNDVYDKSWESAVKSRVFPIVKARFKLFRNSIKEPLGKLPEELIN
jgi:hypothetical protein